MSLSNEMVDVLTYVEQVWWENNKSVPTDEKISEMTGVSIQTVRGYWKNPDFRAALYARGVQFANEPDAGKALTFEQLMVANMLMNIMDKRSLREKLNSAEGLNVTPAQVAAWMRQPAFQAHLRTRSAVMFGDADTSANMALIKAIDAGDLKAVQLYFEMTGRYTPRSQVDVNVHAILARVIEIVSIHVRDPAILQAIADDFTNLEIGGHNQAPAIPTHTLPTPLQL